MRALMRVNKSEARWGLERERKKKRKSRKSRHLLFLVSKKKQMKTKHSFQRTSKNIKNGQMSERADVRRQISESRYQNGQMSESRCQRADT